MKNIIFPTVIVLLSIATTSCGLSGMTGGELYDSCSVALHVPESEQTSEQKIQVARCKKFSQRVFYEEGYVYVGEEKKPKIQDLKKYCPASWASPIGGPYVFLVRFWDKNGMSYMERNVFGAEYAAKSVFNKLYPKCPKKRIAAGVPKVTRF